MTSRRRERTREDFDAVLRFLPIFADPGFHFGSMEAPPGVLPYANLAPQVNEFVSALYEHHWIVPFDWTAWNDVAESYVERPEKLRSADLETLEKLLTAHVRADRFVEGHLLAMCNHGHITRILERLRELAPDA